MRSVLSNSLLILVFATLVISCNHEKKLASIVYFNQPGDTLLSKKVQNYEPFIQVGDRLSILVTALDPAAVAPYNIGSNAAATGTVNGGYVIEKDGTITFPQLGKIKAEGYQRKQLIDTLVSRLEKFVVDPVVTIQFINFKITVLGEVGRQGAYNIPEGKVTLLEAIGLAGDLTLYSRRDNILVIREKNGVREFGNVNLLSKNAFNSPYFVLQQNDVVYVELTPLKIANSDQTLYRNIALGASIFSFISALAALVLNITK